MQDNIMNNNANIDDNENIINDKDYRYKIIENAKETVEKKYTKAKHMKLIDKIYDNLEEKWKKNMHF